MSNRLEISDEAWPAIYPRLAAQPPVQIASTEACRDFLMAVLWVLRSGAQWRLLPAEFGHWNSVFQRFSRWCQHGVWPALHTGCAQLPDLPHSLIDATVIRAHPGAAESRAEAEALGRARGGFSTKIHAITDGLGNPLDCVLTGGQAHDATQGAALWAGAAAFSGDTGYDSAALVQALAARGMAAVSRRAVTAPNPARWRGSSIRSTL